MIITPCENTLDLTHQDGPARAGGLHMSDLYGSLYEELEPTRFVKDSLPDPLKLAAGLAFESHLERVFAQHPGEQIMRPEPFEIDVLGTAVTFSPDLLIFNEVMRLGEIKWTWMSVRGAPDAQKFDKWLCQMKAYLAHLGTRYARLYAYFVCGDYSYPIRPQFCIWDFEFTQREIDENWDMLVNHGIAKGLLAQ